MFVVDTQKAPHGDGSFEHPKHMFKLVAKKIITFYRDGSRISGKGVHMCKFLGVPFADFYLFFIKYPRKMK